MCSSVNLFPVLLLLALPLRLPAQGTSRYHAWLIPVSSVQPQPVTITCIGDSGVFIAAPAVTDRSEDSTFIQASSIGTLQFRRKGSVGRWSTILGATGTILGTIFSMNNWGVPQPSLLLGTGIGIGVGALIGTAKVNFIIEGKRSRFIRLRATMREYVAY